MATVTAKSFDVISLDQIEPGPEHDGRVPLNIRQHFGIEGFGVRAARAVGGDGFLVGEHDQVGLGAFGQEELYLVLSGEAAFNVDGERVPAPAGTLVHVRDTAAKRSATATDGTTVLMISGTPGEAYRLSAGEAMHEMWEPYQAGDYETALAALRPVLEDRPEALVYFNVACMEARLGRTDDAIRHLEQAIEDDDRIREHIRSDEDLDSLRGDPRFQPLTA